MSTKSAARLGGGGGLPGGRARPANWPLLTHLTATLQNPIYVESIAAIWGADKAPLVSMARAQDRLATPRMLGPVSVRAGPYEHDEVAAEHAR